MLHTLYQRNVRANTQFFVEWMALDLIRDADGDWVGVTALEMETGEIVGAARQGGAVRHRRRGRIFSASTNAFINTGDGLGMAIRAGIPLEDMEFWQFHPTGVAGAGVLITEGVRGEGGILLNCNGERFMERYAPNAKDLASRDVVVPRHGRGNQRRPWLWQEQRPRAARHRTSARKSWKRLPRIREIAINSPASDPIKEPIPVVPTCHYQMGGIPTNYSMKWSRRNATNRKTGLRSVTPLANVPAPRCTAPTAWAPTRCWIWWCSANLPATHDRIHPCERPTHGRKTPP